MKKPVFAICEQQRRRSACASSQCDQHLCFSLDSIIPLVSIHKISSLHLASVAAHSKIVARLPDSKLPKASFLVAWFIW